MKYKFKAEQPGLTGIQLLYTCGFKSPFFSAAVGEELEEEAVNSEIVNDLHTEVRMILIEYIDHFVNSI